MLLAKRGGSRRKGAIDEFETLEWRLGSSKSVLKSVLKLSSGYLSSRAQRIRWFSVGILTAPLVGAFYYGYTHQSSPLICPFRYLTGIPCPGCGMTRSFMAIAQGDVRQALDQHLLGPILFVGCLLAVVHIMVELLTCRQTQSTVSNLASKLLVSPRGQALAMVTVLGSYAYRLHFLLSSGELSEAIIRSPLGHLLAAASLS